MHLSTTGKSMGIACTRLTTWTEPWLATAATPAEGTAEAAQAGKEADGGSAGYVYDLYALSMSPADDGADALAALGAPLVQASLCQVTSAGSCICMTCRE